MADNRKRKIINSWAMYDWGNSAFATTIMAAMFPPFYRTMVKNAGLGDNTATVYWAYTVTAALCIVAIIGPLLGAISDYTGHRKRYLAFFAALGIVSTALFVFLGEDTWRAASALFVIANVGFAGANIFYESLLPHIADTEDMDRVSTKGYALGYLGGGLLLVLNLLWLQRPHWFFMPSEMFALRASFASVAVWWALFSIPLLRNVPEPPAARAAGNAMNSIRAGVGRLVSTFRDLRRHRQLLLFVCAFWLYSDGISTIIKMATAYGDQIGIDRKDMIAALVITQFVGIPASFAFGALAKRFGAKRMVLAGLGVYAIISTGGFFMRTATHFYVLAFSVGLVQGGTQALSRSMFGSMIPKEKASEFFGFFSTFSKFAGIAGPLVFGLTTSMTKSSRLGVLSLLVFFVTGAILLVFVDENKAQQARSQ